MVRELHVALAFLDDAPYDEESVNQNRFDFTSLRSGMIFLAYVATAITANCGHRIRQRLFVLFGLRQQTIQLVCKSLPVALVQRRRTAGLYAATAQLVHKVAHTQALADIFFRV